ncbi:DNA polymerase domain-containing protein [Cerasicoccus fimbriatus]|uniref:DNA polymerase domain-containing protein n=1 Tax=Cerasicoccus fimbriatus TaxID=3014554 RepID=UPI0022B36A95|nr:DNA polymerase domain-containing protein [Cerasicoccus sp. TK19100]
MSNTSEDLPIAGVWLDADGQAHVAAVDGEQPRTFQAEAFEPFMWLSADLPGAEDLDGEGAFAWRKSFAKPGELADFSKAHKTEAAMEWLRPIEHQYLLASGRRLFQGLTFQQVRRVQLDIETHSEDPGSFPDARKKKDRVIAIGLRFGDEVRLLEIETMDDDGERALLESLNVTLAELDPDVIEGHNIFKFDLDFLKTRCKRMKVPCAWGRFGQNASFRSSRIRIAERWIDFPRCDIPGRTVFDTFLAIQLFDVTTRDLPSYTLKAAARYLKVTTEADERTYISPEKIQVMFTEDRETFRAYLKDDLRETKGIAELLLPTYVAQVQVFPMALQEACLRGTGSKVDLLFLDKYYHANHAIPAPPEVKPYVGAFSKSFVEGVFHHVMHFDVASLYPSLLLHIGRNPENDSLGVFIPLLTELKDYRLRYKKLAREEADPVLQQEYNARQASYKILINSFYGYLGFAGARFADGDLAAEVTKQGRELLQKLIAEFERLDCLVLEADTDGIYVSSEKDFGDPEALLRKVCSVLPDGIELEYDGSYQAMFCYKAKNYALYDGEKVSIAGSALRSRGMEPILKDLTKRLIYSSLGATEDTPEALETEIRADLAAGKISVKRLAKREFLSQNPEAYKKAVEQGGKSRRASLEVALRMDPMPRMGESVTYYITTGEKKKNPDWQVARGIDEYDAEKAPVDTDYYLRKIDDWRKRYQSYLEGGKDARQSELF